MRAQRYKTIEAEGLGKRYQLGLRFGYGTLRESLGRLPRRALGGRPQPRRDVWALRDVSFDVSTGETLGVIGRNGSGKTTLLRVLSRITEPTIGISRTRGRVATVLDIGTGFHPELTGRENVFLNGAILGMRRHEIARHFDEIVEFAGLRQFMDTPLKRYSSGMGARLAFSIATHLSTELLLVDEVLSVGDVGFQRRSLDRLAQGMSEGRTTVFVSHNLEAIRQLCTRVLWLDEGRIRFDGAPDDTIRQYLNSVVVPPASTMRSADPAHRLIGATVEIRDEDGRPCAAMPRGKPFSIEARFELRNRFPLLDAAIYVTNEHGVRVFDERWSDFADRRPDQPGRYRATLRVPGVLNVGRYTIGLWLGDSFEDILHELAVLPFFVEGSTGDRPERVVDLGLPWEVSFEPEAT